MEFSRLFSDAHRPLSLCVRCDLNEHENDIDVNTVDASNEPKIKKWENEKVHNFVNSLDIGKTDEIMNELDTRDIDIDGVIDKTCTLLLDAASESLGTFKTNYVPSEKKKVRKPQPWFNLDCKNARKRFRQLKGKYILLKRSLESVARISLYNRLQTLADSEGVDRSRYNFKRMFPA